MNNKFRYYLLGGASMLALMLLEKKKNQFISKEIEKGINEYYKLLKRF